MPNTGKELERFVAQAYRQLGARKVEHDVELAGHQIDVFVELETQDHSIHRIVIEAKEYASPVGIQIVSVFSDIVDRLRRERLADSGMVVSIAGFSRQARNAASKHGVRLLEPKDLEAMVTERLQLFLTASQQLGISERENQALQDISTNQSVLISRFENLQLKIEQILTLPNTVQALNIGNEYTKLAKAIASNSAKRIQTTLPRSSYLSIEFLCDVQMSIFPDKYHLVGVRRKPVWIGPAGSTLDNAVFVPPPASEVEKLLQGLLLWWNSQFETLLTLIEEEKINAIAEFHTKFWSIHPFLDGNDEVSRLILSAQLRDMFNKTIDSAYSEGDYHSALLSAALGDKRLLIDIIHILVHPTA